MQRPLDEVQRNIAGNVRRLRGRAEWTQADLADKSGLSINFVARIELARVNLSIATLVALASAFGVAPGALLRTAKAPEPVTGRPRGPRPRS